MKKLEVESTPDSEWLRQIEGLGQLYKIDLEGTPDSDWNGQTEELEQLTRISHDGKEGVRAFCYNWFDEN